MLSNAPTWRRRLTAVAGAFAVVAGIGLAGSVPAAADTRPSSPDVPTTVSADALPTAQIDGVAWSQAVVGNTVYVGGRFSTVRPAGAAAGVNTTTRNNLMAYDIRTGNHITSFAPDLNGQVLAVAASPDGSRIYVGGDFTVANGQTRSRIAAYSTATGQLISTFRPTASTQVRAIVATNSTVYFGGNFQSVSGVARRYLAAASASTGAVQAWDPSADAQVSAITLNSSGSKVVVGGRFQYLRSEPTYGLGAVDPVSGDKVRWDVSADVRNAGKDAGILSLASDADGVYGTAYHFGPGGNLEGTFRADGETGQTIWIEDCHGDTYSVFPTKDMVYTAAHKHHCGNIGSFPEQNPRIHKMAQAFTKQVTGTISHDTQGYYDWFGYPRPTYLHWDPNMTVGRASGQNQAGWSVSGNSDYITYAGEFPLVNNTAQQGLVRFARPGLAPNKRGPNGNDELTPSVVAVSSSKVRIAWQTTFDQDNEDLTYKVYRNFRSTSDTPVCTITAKSSFSFWNRPRIGCFDTTVQSGSRYNYRVYVSDPFGNTTSRAATIIDVPAATQQSAYADAVAADQPTAYYRLGEASGSSVIDSVAFNDATAQAGVTRGAAGAVGDTDTASGFNGADSGYVVTSDQVQGPNTFSVEGWFRTTSTSGGKIVGFGNSKTGVSGSYDRHVYLDNDGRVWFGVYPNEVRTVNSAAGYNDGQWHQFVATMGSDGMALYLDGRRVGSRGDTTTGQDYQGQWRIGGDNIGGWPNQPASNFVAGDIDEVAIYDKAVTRADVVDHYNASGRTLPGSTAPSDAYGAAVYAQDPELYWRLDGPGGAQTADSSPSGNPGNVNGGVLFGSAGALAGQNGKAAGFNGIDGHVVASQPANSPRTYSESIWFKTTSTAGGKLIGFGCSPSGLSGCYDRHVYMSNDGRLTFGVWTGFTNTITTDRALNDGEWHMVVATQDTSEGMKLYVDGELVGTNGQTDAQGYDGWWRIGGDNHWGCCSPYFDATLDEAAVFSKVLPASTVRDLYALGSGTTPNQEPTAAFASTSSGLTASLDGSGSSDPDGTIVSYAWDFGDSTSGTGATVQHTYAAAGTYTVRLTVTDDDGQTSSATQAVTVSRANQKPAAAFTSTSDGLKASFDGSGSSDPDGTIAGYAWDFGDGTSGSGASPERTYAASGTYTVRLTVTDDQGLTDTTTRDVTVQRANEAPRAAFTSSTNGLRATFDSSGSSDDGSIASRAWDFGDGTTGSGVSPERTYASAGTYTVRLTVTDDQGLTDSTTRDVTVTATPTVTELASDGFARTLGSGWGTADRGGAYNLIGAASRFEVAGGRGVMRVPAGSSNGAFLTGVTARDTDTQADLSFDAAVTGGGAFASVVGRGGNANNYRARVKVASNGVVTLYAARVVGGAETNLQGVVVPGLTYQAGDALRVRVQVAGSGTTTVRARVWKVGTSEPSTWQVNSSDTTAALQTQAGVGLQGYLSGSSTVTPLPFRFDDLVVKPIG